jgi:hypothetical protein
MDRRTLLQGALAGAATLAIPHRLDADQSELSPICAQIEKQHDQAVQRLQEWIKQLSIAAENRGVTDGCDLTMRFLRDARKLLSVEGDIQECHMGRVEMADFHLRHKAPNSMKPRFDHVVWEKSRLRLAATRSPCA